MTETVNSNQAYRAWLVRMWPVCRNGQMVWRASAEDAHTGERRAFADLPQLFAFLEETIQSTLTTVQNREHVQ
jgi:dihydroorotase-like cyclic amidohydrolase